MFEKFLVIFFILNHLCREYSLSQINIGNCNRPCENGGSCLNLGTSMAYCICVNQYSGAHCEIAPNGVQTPQIAPSTTTVRITSTSTTTIATTTIATTQSTVRSNFIPCPTDTMICHNGGQCQMNVLTNFFSCDCPPSYARPFCFTRTAYCNPNPCKNGGICETTGQFEGRCVCPNGFNGPTCDIGVGCNPNPCRDRRPCVTLNGSPVCL